MVLPHDESMLEKILVSKREFIDINFKIKKYIGVHKK